METCSQESVPHLMGNYKEPSLHKEWMTGTGRLFSAVHATAQPSGSSSLLYVTRFLLSSRLVLALANPLFLFPVASAALDFC